MLISFVLLYLALTVAIGIWAARRVKTSKDFVLAGRSLPLYMTVATVFATWLGAETVLSVSATFARDGLGGVVADPFGASFCLVFVALFFARALYRMDLLTIGDFYRRRYNRPVEVATSVAITLSYLGWTSAQLTALGLMFSTLSGGTISLTEGILIGGASVLCRLPDNCELTSRLTLDARLYMLPGMPTGKRGRPRKWGERLPTPREMFSQRGKRLTLRQYGRRDRVRVIETLACAHAAPRRLLRVVAVEPLSGGRTRQAFFSTRTAAGAADVLAWYAQRWSIEVAFHDSKTHLGFEEPQGWTRQAVERTAPTAMLLYSLIVHWFVIEGHRHYRPAATTWYVRPHASFGDMLATLRSETLREQLIAWGLTAR